MLVRAAWILCVCVCVCVCVRWQCLSDECDYDHAGGWDESLITVAIVQSASLDAALSVWLAEGRRESQTPHNCPKVDQTCALVCVFETATATSLRWRSQTPPWIYSRSFISCRISPCIWISLWTRCTTEERITSLNPTDQPSERCSSSHIPLLSSSRCSETWWFVTLLLRINGCTQWQVCSSWI